MLMTAQHIIGLTQKDISAIRDTVGHKGWTKESWSLAMSTLRRIYLANKTVSEIPINFFDNIYGYSLPSTTK